MCHKETESYEPEFGNLKVEFVAPYWYFAMTVKKDRISYQILDSKKRDKSSYFWEKVKECFKELDQHFDLVCVIPNSEQGYSPTLISIGKKMKEEFKIPFENIILRTKKPMKKMTECTSAKERLENQKGTLELSRRLGEEEKTILLIDDTKASGDTALFCASLLNQNGAQTVKCICLGINTQDATRVN